jgi:thiol-disulfide isomerase/thioredoxin
MVYGRARDPKKGTSWRQSIRRQALSGVTIRAWCQDQRVNEAPFPWRTSDFRLKTSDLEPNRARLGYNAGFAVTHHKQQQGDRMRRLPSRHVFTGPFLIAFVLLTLLGQSACAGQGERDPRPADPTVADPPAKPQKPVALLEQSARVGQGGPESRPADTTAADPPSTPQKPDERDSQPRSFEETWRQFASDATKQYGFGEDMAKQTDRILQYCLSRAKQLRERHAAGGDTSAGETAGSKLEVSLKKLNDQLLDRIDALATVEQVENAAKAGFKSPERLDPTPKPEVGFAAPPFSLKTPQGQTVSLDSLRGKVVVLHFWAPWCGFCKKAMPGIQKLHETLKDEPRVAIYGVVGSEKGKSDPVALAKEKGCTYDLLLKGAATALQYGVKGYPTLFIVGADGKIIHHERGAKPEQDTRLVPIIKKALERKAG